MGLLDTNGDGSVYIKGTGGSVKIGAGNTDQVTVGGGGVTVSNQLNLNSDINASSGGMVKNFEFAYLRLSQNSTPIMSASQMTFSGTAAQGHATTIYFSKIPMRNSGSVVGVCLISEDGIVAGGGLTASILLNGVPMTGTDGSRAILAVPSGSSQNVVTWNKDLYPFNGNGFIQVQLTATAGYLNNVALSCSWLAFVDAEY